jgi:RNA polymerase sigma factor (sigma-70 family)
MEANITYYKEVEKYPVITLERQKELLLKLKSGDDSVREELITGNLKLVLKVVNDFQYHFGFKQDLIAEGNIGLMEAIDRFDINHKTRFSTYATYWIRQRILAYLNQKIDLVRLPTFLNIRIRRLKILQEEFFLNFGREPDEEEICEMLDIRSKSWTWTKHAMQMTKELRIDQENGNEFNASLFSLHDDILEPTDLIINAEHESKLMEVLEKLDGVEARIIQLRFFEGCTLKETAEKMGVWIDWVRRLENKTLLKIKELFIHGELKDPKKRIYKKLQRRV